MYETDWLNKRMFGNSWYLLAKNQENIIRTVKNMETVLKLGWLR